MRRAVLLGKPESKRALYLQQAAEGAGLPLQTMDWKDWKTGISQDDIFLKIDPIVWESCSLEELDRLTEEYRGYLQALSYMSREHNITFLNDPETIELLLDKRACKNRLLQEGLSVTELLSEDGKRLMSVGELLEQMEEKRIYQVFIKPVRGSGAAGVSAFRWQPASGRMALYTCALQSAEYGLVNTKRLRCFTGKEELIPLLNRILALDCIVEKWYAKAVYQNFSYDIRVVMQDKQMDFILARLSQGPITNLHLNNHPLEVSQLGLPSTVLESIALLCEQSMERFPGLKSAGIDILLEKGSLNPRIIEMNAQGDLIYQDIYHENKIYHRQAQMMKEWLEA